MLGNNKREEAIEEKLKKERRKFRRIKSKLELPADISIT
jgi:hypothetical protein